jgi:glyoxylase-like metal-dependent hydrolase (beta-lactamase superfamily II)
VSVRIAERWFEVKRIDDAVTLLWEPHLHPVWQSNIWHVRGADRDLLIDAGMGIGDLAAEVRDLAGKPIIAVATHRHADPIGGFHQFETRLAHPLDAEEIANPVSFASLIKSDYPPEFVAFLEREGNPANDVLIDAYPSAEYDPRAYTLQPAPATELVEEGDTIDIGDRVFTVLHLPGHSPGSIGLWDDANGALFSGDAVYDGPLYDFLPESNIADYVETMRRLLDLPVTVVHGGHDGSFGRERLIEIANKYLAQRADKASAHEARSA